MVRKYGARAAPAAVQSGWMMLSALATRAHWLSVNATRGESTTVVTRRMPHVDAVSALCRGVAEIDVEVSRFNVKVNAV